MVGPCGKYGNVVAAPRGERSKATKDGGEKGNTMATQSFGAATIEATRERGLMTPRSGHGSLDTNEDTKVAVLATIRISFFSLILHLYPYARI